MFEQQKVIKRKRINLHVPNSGKLRVLTPGEIGELSTALNKISALEKDEEKLVPAVGVLPLQYHQGISDNCTQNTNAEPDFLNSTTQIDVMPLDLQNALKGENMSSAIHELTNLHKTAKYQAFKKRVIDGQTKTDEKDLRSSNIFQIKSDSENENDGGKSANSNQILQSSKDERRKKNKEAARRCRMKKKMLQNEIAMRAAFLAQENSELRSELDMLNHQMEQLRGEFKDKFKN